MAIDPDTGAMTSRITSVFNLPELGLFFITGQPSGTQRFDQLGERHASVAARPYNALTAAEVADFTDKSGDIAKCRVNIVVNTQTRKVEFYDQFTKVTSYCPFEKLDAAVRARFEQGTPPAELGL